MRPFALLPWLPLLFSLPADALDPHRAASQYVQHRWTAGEGLPRAAIEALRQDAEGYLRIRTGKGTVRFDGRNFVPVEPLAAHGPEASALSLRDRDGNLWTSVPGGLLRSPQAEGDSRNEGDLLPLVEGPSPARVTCLLEDREGTLWVGTASSGLIALSDGDFILWGAREGLSSSAARSAILDHAGALWVGTDGGGLNRLEGRRVRTYTSADGLASDVVLAVYETAPGTLWIGTAGGGLNRLRGGEISRFTVHDGLTSTAITSLYGDREGSLWIGTAGGGLNRYLHGRFDAFTTADGLSNDIVRALLQDGEGDLWIGTDSGLNRFRNGRITSYSTRDGLAGDQILALHEDRDGVLWIGTDSGLSRKRDTTFISYTQREGLFNDGLRQILDDHHNRLWFCSNKGLFYLEKDSFAEASSSPDRRLVTRALPAARNLDCSGYSQPSAWQGKDGRMWFATNSGVLEVDPGRVSPPAAPSIHLEKVLAGSSSLPVGQPAFLPAGSRDIEFHFTAPALLDAPRLRFRYRLEPFDRAWIDNGSRRSARYTNLPMGSFRFLVAASVGGPWSRPEAVFHLDVPKPFYRTKGAVSAALLLGLVLSRGIYQLRIQHLVRRNQRLARQVADSTQQAEVQRLELDRATQRLEEANRRLEKANEELFELDQENTDFLALAAHDLREPLVTLRGFTSELQELLKVLERAAADLQGELSPDRSRNLSLALGEDIPEALGFIGASTERMDQLIHGLLSLSQLGRQKLRFELLDVQAMVEEVLMNLRYQISRQGAEVETGSLPPVVADRASMKLIFENLLNNAVHYLQSGRPGKIVVSGEATSEGCTYRIRDNGRGISAAEGPRIFQIFGRGDAARRPGEDQVPGEGLGLAFVRTTIERHGGSISFESQPGEGTTFFFSLPRLPPEVRNA